MKRLTRHELREIYKLLIKRDKFGKQLKKEEKKELNELVKRGLRLRMIPQPDDIVEMKFQRDVNKGDAPAGYSEMKESGRMANWFWKKLEKYPALKKMGYREEDVWDYTQD